MATSNFPRGRAKPVRLGFEHENETLTERQTAMIDNKVDTDNLLSTQLSLGLDLDRDVCDESDAYVDRHHIGSDQNSALPSVATPRPSPTFLCDLGYGLPKELRPRKEKILAISRQIFNFLKWQANELSKHCLEPLVPAQIRVVGCTSEDDGRELQERILELWSREPACLPFPACFSIINRRLDEESLSYPDLVYLCPDAEDSLDPSEAPPVQVVVGMLIDRRIQLNRSLNRASHLSIRAARWPLETLPINQFQIDRNEPLNVDCILEGMQQWHWNYSNLLGTERSETHSNIKPYLATCFEKAAIQALQHHAARHPGRPVHKVQSPASTTRPRFTAARNLATDRSSLKQICCLMIHDTMLLLNLKAAVRFDLQSALAKWLDSDQQVSFSPRNPLEFVLPKPNFSSAECRNELVRLQSLRNCLCDALLKSTSHKAALEDRALEDCYEYHATLLAFERQGFPTLDDEMSTRIQLTWKAAWGPQQEKHATMIWDRAVIAFNTAALLISKASDCSVTDRDECKQGVGYCQQAATVLSYLRELVQSQDFATVDLSQPMLLFWEKYTLAQAQSFVYRMAALSGDGTTHGSLAGLSQSAYLLLNEALTAAQDARLESELPNPSKEWASYCKAVAMLSSAKADYHQSVVHRLASEWGHEISRLNKCKAKLESCRDFCLSLDADGVASYTKRECLAILPVVTDRLAEANDYNYRIYQEKVPNDLSDITPKQLAKISPNLPEPMLVPQRPLFVNVST